MPEKVLGLDIGEVSIKALLLERKGRLGGRILALETINIADCGGMEPAIRKIAENKSLTGVPCSVSLPPQDVMFRQVTLPFHDDGKIRKTLPFELEPLIPFAVDEIAADYLPGADGRLLVAVALKKTIRERIALVEGVLGEVPVIDVSSAPLASLMSGTGPTAAGSIMLDIGSVSTMVNFYEGGSLVQVRSLAFGTDLIIRALAESNAQTIGEAKQRIMNGDYGNTETEVHDALCRFCLEIKNTIEFMLLDDTLKKYPCRITLTGGGALFTPLARELENYFALPVEVFNLQEARQIEIDESVAAQYNPQIMNGALANALRLSAGVRSFNLRQGDFKVRKTAGRLQAHLKWAIPAVALILVLAAVNAFLDYRLQAQRLADIKKQISYLFKKNYPEAATMVDPLSQLKTKLAENRKTLGFYESGYEVQVLDLLKDISGNIASSLDVVITNFSFENEVILIKGEAKSIDAVSAVKNELMKSKYFKDVSIGSTNLARQGGKVDFDLRITLK